MQKSGKGGGSELDENGLMEQCEEEIFEVYKEQVKVIKEIGKNQGTVDYDKLMDKILGSPHVQQTQHKLK